MRVAVICLASVLALAACSKKPASQAAAPAGGSETGAAPAKAGEDAPMGKGGNVFMPHRKAGLWQVGIDASGGPGVQMRAEMCVDASTDKDFTWHGPKSASQNCEKTRMRPVMGGFSFDTVCRSGSRTISSHGTVTGDFDRAYKVDVATTIDPPPPGGVAHEMKSQINAKWLGPCPAGMKPGSMKMGGMTIGGG